MKSCPSQKKMYPSESVAIDALIEARTHFEFKLNQGPVAVYLCDDCSHYHLTSQGNMNTRLAKYLNDGTLNKRLISGWITEAHFASDSLFHGFPESGMNYDNHTC